MIESTPENTPRYAATEGGERVDAKGRTHPEDMTDRDLLVELVTTMRQVGDAVEAFADTPMVKAMQSGGNPLLAMMKG